MRILIIHVSVWLKKWCSAIILLWQSDGARTGAANQSAGSVVEKLIKVKEPVVKVTKQEQEPLVKMPAPDTLVKVTEQEYKPETE